METFYRRLTTTLWDKSEVNFLICSFIHSFILAISIAPLQVIYHSEALPTTARILYRSFTPKRPGNCKGLAQGPYVTARAGVEPTTLRLRVIASTNAPSRPTMRHHVPHLLLLLLLLLFL